MLRAVLSALVLTAAGGAAGAADDEFKELKAKWAERVKEGRAKRVEKAKADAAAADAKADEQIAALNAKIMKANSSDARAMYRAEIRAVERRKADHQKSVEAAGEWLPDESLRDLKPGWFGMPRQATVRVVQVIDGRAALLSWGGTTMWAELGTKNLTDGKDVNLAGNWFHCVGTKTYTTVTGAARTVPHVKVYADR
jgi:hypothetical protein